MNTPLPAWADAVLLPILNLALALMVATLTLWATGVDPLQAMTSLAVGSLGSADAIGYTLYYATDMIFSGLAVAIAFQCGLFNIGAEGQAYVAGLGAALVCLNLGFLPAPVLIPLAIVASAAFGAIWGGIPGWLQARRGSHIVITTIMFNFIAAGLMVYVIVNLLIAPNQLSPQTPNFPEAAALPSLSWLGLPATTPLNAAFILALIAAALVWVLIWHTSWGYKLRVTGSSPKAAAYAGIDQPRAVVLAMLLSGALASGIAVNELLGVQHRLQIGFTGGYGFTGIAVALMGRSHPLGVLLAALLFGALYQGGAELAFDMPNVSADLVVFIQGLVILFTGALGGTLRPLLTRLFTRRTPT